MKLLRLILAAFFFVVFASLGNAAVTPNSIVTPQTPNRGVLQFTSSSTAGTYATLYTAGANGSKCFAMWSTNNDGSLTHLLTVQIVNGGTKYGGTAITTTSNQGFANAVPALNVMSPTNWPGLPLDSAGNPYISLANGDTLQATFATGITATDVLNIIVSCSDY